MESSMKIFATLVISLMFFTANCESKYESFENGLPSHAKASRPNSVKTSSDHYKHGQNSLEWNWRRGDRIRFKHGLGNIKRTGGYAGTYSKASFGVWVYCETQQQGYLQFNFQTKGKTSGYFKFPLNFKGWRRASLRYSWKPQFKGKVKTNTDSVVVEAGGALQGKCFIDLMVYNGVMDFREQLIPGEIKWSPTKPASKYSLSKKLSNSELTAIEKIGKAMEEISCNNKKPSNIKNLEKRFKAFNIKETAKGVKGQPLVGEPRTKTDFYESGVDCKGLQTPEQITKLMKDIAVTYTLSKSGKDKNKLAKWYVLLARHLDDQGFTAGANWWNWYPGRDLAEATFLMRNVLRENNFLKAPAEFFDYNYKTSKIFNHDTINPDMDIFHIDTRYQLNGALMQGNMPEIARSLKAFSNYLSAEILFEGKNGLKSDGCAFHHDGQYYCYARYAMNSLFLTVNALSGTPFAINNQAYERLKKVMLAMRFYSGLKEPALPLHGRHPFSPGDLQPKAFYNLAVSSPQGIDPELAAAYIRLEPDSANAKELKSKGYKAEKAPQGHQTFNMGAFTVHRRDNWLATAKGYSKYVWHGETYQHNNRYGRYLSNGSLYLTFGEGLKSSGLVQDGFDWNRIDGATVIYLPLDKLKTKGGTEMIRNDQRFVGGLSHFGKNGLFTTQIQGPEKYSPDFLAKKSLFFIDDTIVCLGSNITNSKIQAPVQTNLFQRKLDTAKTPIIIDGSEITAFPDQKKLTANKPHWIIDTNKTGYYIPEGTQIKYSRKSQKSRTEQDKKSTQGNFVSAWIDHGVNPQNASYIYFVFPVSSKDKLVKFAKAQKTANKPVKILKQDASAHAVNFTADKIWAAALFKAQKTDFLPVVKAVNRACLIMLTKNGNKYKLTVTDPDLNFQPKDKHRRISRQPGLKLSLDGQWQLEKAGKNLKTIKYSANETVLQIDGRDGLSNDIILSPPK
jgi:chondroitin-sulfate-ABC endolyase/exolyase